MLCNMFLWVFLCLLGKSCSKFTEVYSPDVCTTGDCLIRSSKVEGDTSSLLQKGWSFKMKIASSEGSLLRTTIRRDINTTQMMASDAFKGFRWMASETTAACQHENNGTLASDGHLTLAACKSKCLQVGYCMAFDFQKVSGQCKMYTAPCGSPATTKKGSTSYRLHILMKAKAPKPLSMAQATALQEPEEGEAGEGEAENAEGAAAEGEAAEGKAGEEGGEKKEGEEGEEEVNEYESAKMEEQIVAAVSVSLILVFVVSEQMERYNCSFLPEGCMVILQGVFLGLVLKYWAGSVFMEDPVFRCEISIELLNLVFLPLLMFESGWSVRRLDFISQFPYIMIFAVIGTLISTYVIGMLLYQVGQMGWHGLTHYRSCFVVASLISTTDPVATLATYGSLRVDPLLNIIVFGEAAINDAVGIVVFSIVNDDKIMASMDSISEMIVMGGLKGASILSCSFLLGLLVSSIVCWCLKYFKMRDNKKLEILIVVASCYLAFALGEYFKVSGIICTLFSGMITGQYARPHLSIEGSLLTSFFISQMCMVMDAGIFLLSGVCCICLSFHGVNLGLSLLLLCAVGRLCSTIPCGIFVNSMKRSLNADQCKADQHILSGKYLFMIWHAGLRGGIAENLSMQIGTWINDLDGPQAKEAVRSSVFLVVCCYVLVFGGTTKFFLKFLKIPMGAEYAEDALSSTESGMEDWRIFNWLHFGLLKPMLVGEEGEEEDGDVDMSGLEGKDVEEILKVVTRQHRGGKPPEKDAHKALTAED